MKTETQALRKKFKAAGSETERPNPRVPANLMARVRAAAKREGLTINLALITLIRRGLKV